jgi:hypothetical protein
MTTGRNASEAYNAGAQYGQGEVNFRQETILEEAGRIVDGPRRDTYGHPFDDHTAVGLAWTGILSKHLGIPITILPAHVVSMMMVAVKVVREVGVHDRDNLVDIAGYGYCADIEYNEGERRGLLGVLDATSAFVPENNQFVVCEVNGCTFAVETGEGRTMALHQHHTHGDDT